MRVALRFLVRIQRDERAQDLLEYALLAGFIAIASGALSPPIASGLSVVFSKMTSIVNNSATQ